MAPEINEQCATLVRFDVAYRGAFHCAPGAFIAGAAGFPHLQHYARELYQLPGVAHTCEFGVYLTFYMMLPMTMGKLGCLAGSMLTLLGVKKELLLPHERGPKPPAEQRYGPYSQPGAHALMSKLSLLLNTIAIVFAAAYLLDRPVFDKMVDISMRAVSFNRIEYPDEWG